MKTKTLYYFLVSVILLSLATSCGKDEEDGVAAQTEKENGGKDDDGNKDSGKEDFKPVVVPDVVVTVDDSGQADGGHNFQKIDETKFIIDGVQYSMENDHLVVSEYDKTNSMDAVVIISTLKYQGSTMDVTRIKKLAFKGCAGITSCVIGNKVTSIGEEAFDGCTSLSSVTIPSSVTNIDKKAFEHCRGLSSVTIPSSVTSIGRGTFHDCSGLRHVYCHAVNPPSAEDLFGETPISSATLHVPAESLDAYKATSPWSGFGTIVAL